MKRHVALVGFMASGKSTIGRRLARKLGWKFVDTDLLVASYHGPIATIFLQEGEAGFRRYERAAISAALRRSESHVIALGGGALTTPENRKALEEYAYRIFIKISPEQALTRVLRSREKRPMLGDTPTLERIKALYDDRMSDYASSDLIVDAFQLSDASIIERILRWLSERPIAVTPIG